MGLGNHKGVVIGISFLHEGMSERKEGAVLLTLKAEEGTMSQRLHVSLEAGKVSKHNLPKVTQFVSGRAGFQTRHFVPIFLTHYAVLPLKSTVWW